MVVHIFSPDGRYDEKYLRNFALLQIKDTLARIPGMGDVQLFGSGDYSMRVWLDPQKMAGLSLTAGDVIAASHRRVRRPSPCTVDADSEG